jgi:hypothetical protein
MWCPFQYQKKTDHYFNYISMICFLTLVESFCDKLLNKI